VVPTVVWEDTEYEKGASDVSYNRCCTQAPPLQYMTTTQHNTTTYNTAHYTLNTHLLAASLSTAWCMVGLA